MAVIGRQGKEPGTMVVVTLKVISSVPKKERMGTGRGACKIVCARSVVRILRIIDQRQPVSVVFLTIPGSDYCISYRHVNTGPTIMDTRGYNRFSEVANDVVNARVYLGIHFRFADTAARTR